MKASEARTVSTAVARRIEKDRAFKAAKERVAKIARKENRRREFYKEFSEEVADHWVFSE